MAACIRGSAHLTRTHRAAFVPAGGPPSPPPPLFSSSHVPRSARQFSQVAGRRASTASLLHLHTHNTYPRTKEPAIVALAVLPPVRLESTSRAHSRWPGGARRSNKNIYAQIIDDSKGVVLCSASTKEKGMDAATANGG